jgi:hypothetical protein
MSQRPSTPEKGSRTTKLGRRACIKCDLPAVEALRLDETTPFPVPLCRNHVRRARKYEESLHKENRDLYWDRVRDASANGGVY